MEYLNQLLRNEIVFAGIIAWAVAQVLKTIIHSIVNRKIELSRLLGDGGMPSGHSATVTSVALATGLKTGFDSPVFAVACIIAIVVMHDASGVRLEAGKQAKVLNELLQVFVDMGSPTLTVEAKLKEFVGHTHIQVFAGFCLGIISTLLYLYL